LRRYSLQSIRFKDFGIFEEIYNKELLNQYKFIYIRNFSFVKFFIVIAIGSIPVFKNKLVRQLQFPYIDNYPDNNNRRILKQNLMKKWEELILFNSDYILIYDLSTIFI
jgi:hypothetical protein